MREISCRRLAEAIEELVVRAATMLPPDVVMQLECAADAEPEEVPQQALIKLVRHVVDAGLSGIPVSRETGQAVVFADIGRNSRIVDGSMQQAVDTGMQCGAERCRQLGNGDNAVWSADMKQKTLLRIHEVEGESVRLKVAFTSWTGEAPGIRRCMVSSDETLPHSIADAVLQLELDANAPIVVGVGWGKTAEQAALLAEKGLYRPLDRRNPVRQWEIAEREALRQINSRGGGIAGLGGGSTALALNIEVHPNAQIGMPCVLTAGSYMLCCAECML